MRTKLTMTFYSTRRDNGDCRALQSEIDRLVDERRERQEREQREQEERIRERRDAMRRAECEASTWSEAFGKNGRRLAQELAETKRDAAQFPGADWTDTGLWEREIAANDRAAALHTEAQAELAALQQSLLERIAAALDTEYPGSSVADALRSGDPHTLVYW